jgi:hypothetical protein
MIANGYIFNRIQGNANLRLDSEGGSAVSGGKLRQGLWRPYSQLMIFDSKGKGRKR